MRLSKASALPMQTSSICKAIKLIRNILTKEYKLQTRTSERKYILFVDELIEVGLLSTSSQS